MTGIVLSEYQATFQGKQYYSNMRWDEIFNLKIDTLSLLDGPLAFYFPFSLVISIHQYSIMHVNFQFLKMNMKKKWMHKSFKMHPHSQVLIKILPVEEDHQLK